jgi:WhiB family redox-sensing transcriptional regulator
MGAELFFPAGERGEEAVAQIRQAKAICARCPVRLHCLVFALSTNQEDGTWGGLTPTERRSLRRRRAAHRQARAVSPPGRSGCSGVG